MYPILLIQYVINYYISDNSNLPQKPLTDKEKYALELQQQVLLKDSN